MSFVPLNQQFVDASPRGACGPGDRRFRLANEPVNYLAKHRSLSLREAATFRLHGPLLYTRKHRQRPLPTLEPDRSGHHQREFGSSFEAEQHNVPGSCLTSPAFMGSAAEHIAMPLAMSLKPERNACKSCTSILQPSS